ncbi:hypothetical protein TMatcc_010586 [Talaromyces marneffei ATCC 18224]
MKQNHNPWIDWHHLWQSVIYLLRDHRIKISNEKLSANFDRLLFICRSLIHANRFSIKADLVHNSSSIFGIFFANELDETVALVCLRNSIFGQVDVDDAASLEHKFPY